MACLCSVFDAESQKDILENQKSGQNEKPYMFRKSCEFRQK
jgi:hypothetical protein